MIFSTFSILSIHHGIHSPYERVTHDTGLAVTFESVSGYVHIEIIWTMFKAITITMSHASVVSDVNATRFPGNFQGVVVTEFSQHIFFPGVFIVSHTLPPYKRQYVVLNFRG